MTFLSILATLALPVRALDVPAVSTQSSLFGPPALVASISISTYISSHTLSLFCDECQFHCWSDVLTHICNYPKRQDRMHSYDNVVRQATQIFNINVVFALVLINAIMKDKSFEMELWTKNQVNQLVAPIKRHVKATRVGRSRREEVLKTINRY